MPFRRRRRFGTHSRAAITQSTCTLKRKTKCRGCGAKLAAGDVATRLRLKKRYQAPCSTCGHKPAKLKYFHAACVPPDINKAMGYDPNAGAAHVHATGNAVPPPPKPKSVEDIQFDALNAIVAAIKARCANNPKLIAELKDDFKTFQGISARALRPGTAPEGQTAMKMAMIRALKLVF